MDLMPFSGGGELKQRSPADEVQSLHNNSVQLNGLINSHQQKKNGRNIYLGASALFHFHQISATFPLNILSASLPLIKLTFFFFIKA